MDEIEQQFAVDTPESVEFRYTLAGIGSRFCAALIDHLIMGLILLLVIFLGGIAVNFLKRGDAELSASLLTALIVIVSFVVLAGYYVVLETVQRGQSIGKRALGLRVIRKSGLPITFSDSLLRNLLRVVDFLPVSYALGVVTMFFDGQWRRLGDLAANTVVVREGNVYQLSQISVRPQAQQPVYAASSGNNLLQKAVPLSQPLAYQPQAARVIPAAESGILPSGYQYVPNIERMSEFEYQLVRDYLMRRLTLPYERQVTLARDLSYLVANKIALYQPINNYLIFLNQAAESYEQSRLR